MAEAIDLCILENGLVPELLEARHGSYPQMVINWLSPALPEARFHVVSPVSGERLPEPEAFDGYILTGSPHSVYERSEWIAQEITFLRGAKAKQRPIFGICFGHQLMADAFGGRTQEAPQGWGLGPQRYQYDQLALGGEHFVFHQDQVLELPPQARCVGGSSHCRYGALAYSFAALSVQYHPEFTPEYVRALLEMYGGNDLPTDRAEAALAALEQQAVDNQPVAQWVAAFFRQYAPRR